MEPALINVENARLKLSLTLDSFLTEGETFELGPFSQGTLVSTTVSSESTSPEDATGDLTRCSIEAPSGVLVSRCIMTETMAYFSVGISTA